jgi:hypothetical protein
MDERSSRGKMVISGVLGVFLKFTECQEGLGMKDRDI